MYVNSTTLPITNEQAIAIAIFIIHHFKVPMFSIQCAIACVLQLQKKNSDEVIFKRHKNPTKYHFNSLLFLDNSDRHMLVDFKRMLRL